MNLRKLQTVVATSGAASAPNRIPQTVRKLGYLEKLVSPCQFSPCPVVGEHRYVSALRRTIKHTNNQLAAAVLPQNLFPTIYQSNQGWGDSGGYPKYRHIAIISSLNVLVAICGVGTCSYELMLKKAPNRTGYLFPP